jgi:hypothetical protein
MQIAPELKPVRVRLAQRRLPRNKGLRYPPDPPTIEKIIAVMRAAGETSDACRSLPPR